MNATLALYFDDHALLAAIEPFEGKFTLLGKGESPRYAFFFHLSDQGVSYGQGYEEEARQATSTVFQEVYTRIQAGGTFEMQGYQRDWIELLEPILRDLREDYGQQMKTFTDGTRVSSHAAIPIRICYSENIPTAVRPKLEAYLKRQRFEIAPEQAAIPGSLHLFRRLMDSRQLAGKKALYGLVEGLHEALNLSLIEVLSPREMRRLALETYPGFGIDPRLGVLAKFVVDEINRSRHVLDTEADKQAEYARHLDEAAQWNIQLLSTRRPHITVTACLAATPNSPAPVTIQRKVIDNLTKMRSQQVSRFFDNLLEQQGTTESLEKVIIFGDAMNNDHVLDGFYRYGKDRLLVLGNERIGDILKGMQVPESALTPASKGLNIPDDLQAGDKISFSWAPNRQVKAIYNGNRSFMIIAHQHSSVITGDTFSVIDPLLIGQPAMLKQVMRTTTGKVLGDYRSGPLTELKKVGN